VVARSVDRAGLHDDAGQAGGDEPLRLLVREVLGLVVVRDVPAGMHVRLVDDLALGVAERVDGGDVHDLAGAGVETGGEDGTGALDVGGVHRGPLLRRDADLVDGGSVDGRVRAVEAAQHGLAIHDVALDQRAADGGQRLRAARRTDQRDDVVAPRAQPPGHLAADETGAAREEHLHGAQA
jgi:hypothetical protein